MPDLARRLAVARGDEPADLVVRGGRVFSVFTREWLEATWRSRRLRRRPRRLRRNARIDASGRCVVPGFVDAHMHLESSKLLVDEFARLVLPLGTTAVVADPHEIANVLGTDGVHWLPTCARPAAGRLLHGVVVRAASEFESPRRPLAAGRPRRLLRRRRVIGLAEMMNFPGVVAGCERAGEARAGRRGARRRPRAERPRQGAERLRRGRDPLRPRGAHGRGGPRAPARGHVAADPRGLRRPEPARPAPARHEFGPHRIAFCTDDREPEHIADEGHINSMVREAVAAGVAPEDALVMASFNPAPGTACATSGRSRPATRRTCSSFPTSRASCPSSC